MTIALLTQILAEPSEPSVRPRSQSGSDDGASRKDDKDFASVMSESGQDSRTDIREAGKRPDTQQRGIEAGADSAKPRDTGAEPAENTDPAEAASRDGAPPAQGAESDAGDKPRRQVTIPELPARRGASDQAIAGLVEPEPKAGAVPAKPEGGLAGAASVGADAEPVPQTALARRSDVAAVAASETGAGLARPETAALVKGAAGLAQPTGAMPDDGTHDTAPAAQSGRDGVEETPRLHGLANAETRVPAPAMTAIQEAQARNMRRIQAEAIGEDRAARKAQEPLARAIEAAATPTAPTPQVTATQTSVAAQMAVLQPAARDALANKEKGDSAFALEGETESLRFDLRGTAGSGSTQHGSAVAALARSDVARGVAMQIGDMVRAKPDRPIDVSLSPEELGRVRLSISTGEGGVTLHILAERPETLELMRRHADMLARELAGLGFASIDLAFGQGRDPESGADGDRADTPKRGGLAAIDDTTAAPAENAPVNRMTLGPDGGLDIRI